VACHSFSKMVIRRFSTRLYRAAAPMPRARASSRFVER
jgi:hypothetical protein